MGHKNLNSVISSATFITICAITLYYAGASCPPLSVMPGTIVICELPAENRTVDCTNGTENIRKGTVGKYRCERDKNFSDNRLKCGCKGRWRRLQMFNDFMSSCNISDYSLAGPAELNLTEREIRKLALPELAQRGVKDFQEDALAYHNFYRAIHHSPPLELNTTLSDAAQKWAEQIADESTLKLQPWSDRWYAQQLYRIIGNGIDAREAVKLAVAAWYQGAYRYDWENPSGQSAFTQLVWKSTTDVGIGVAQRGNQTVVVADYYPPGNVIVSNNNSDDKWAWFRINVFPPNLVTDNDNMNSNNQIPASKTSESTSTTTTTTEAATTST